MDKLRPSNAGRWVNCPASPVLESDFPDNPSEDAREGIAAHWVAAQVLGGHFQIEELTDRAAPNGVIITGEMVEHVETYVAAVQMVGIPIIEQPLPQWSEYIEPGKPDAIRVDGAIGYLFDFKYGYAIVEAIGNWQLACYAIGMFTKHPELQTVNAWIIQPRPFHYEGRARSWTITRAEALGPLYAALEGAAINIASLKVECATGHHCNYCKALHVCEAARRAALNGVDVSLGAMSFSPQGDALAGELHTLRRAAETIKLRLDAIESHATALIDSGQLVPGWSLERAWGRRQWLDGVTMLEALTGQTLTEIRPITPAKAEKKGINKALVKQFTTTPETGRKLVPRDSSAKARAVFQ